MTTQRTATHCNVTDLLHAILRGEVTPSVEVAELRPELDRNAVATMATEAEVDTLGGTWTRDVTDETRSTLVDDAIDDADEREQYPAGFVCWHGGTWEAWHEPTSDCAELETEIEALRWVEARHQAFIESLRAA